MRRRCQAAPSCALRRSGPDVSYHLEPRYPSSPDLSTIRQGCWHEQAATIRYAGKSGAVTERTILPLDIADLDRKLMVLAWCCLRNAFRMLRADRVSDANLAGESLRPRRASMFGAARGVAQHHVHIDESIRMVTAERAVA